MKSLCLIKTPMCRDSLQTLCRIMGGKYQVEVKQNGSFTDRQLENAAVIFGNPGLGTLKKCKNLKWLQLASSGADGYALSGVLDANKTVITNATGAYGHAIAEHMAGCVLALYKKLHLYRDNQNMCLWQDMGSVKTVNGSNVLVVGLRDIGGKFAEIMHRLGASVYAIKRTPVSVQPWIKFTGTLEDLDRLLPQMDIVALCLPNSPQTQKVIGDRQLELMKDDSLLINVGRGSAIDTNALVSALKSGLIGAAALDVTDPEPLPADHPLWKEKNALITPHISGGYHAQETVQAIESVMIENAKRYISGQPLVNIVDYNTGYRRSQTAQEAE